MNDFRGYYRWKFKCDFQTTFGILLTDQQISGPLNELNDVDYWLSREELLIPQYYHWSDDEINLELGMIDFAVYRNLKVPHGSKGPTNRSQYGISSKSRFTRSGFLCELQSLNHQIFEIVPPPHISKSEILLLTQPNLLDIIIFRWN